jgi:hypothetical protein
VVEMEFKESKNPNGDTVLNFDKGYAVIHNNKLWVPAIWDNMGEILDSLVEKTGIKDIIFSAVLNPDKFKEHLRNIIKEWDEWHKEVGDYSHCIEIKYEKMS